MPSTEPERILHTHTHTHTHAYIHACTHAHAASWSSSSIQRTVSFIDVHGVNKFLSPTWIQVEAIGLKKKEKAARGSGRRLTRQMRITKSCPSDAPLFTWNT